MKCLICQKRKAVKVDPFGYLPCKVCQKRQRKIVKPRITAEITTNAIKEDRKIYETDITQPWRNGSLSKEFVQAYPDKVKQMIKEGTTTKEEVKRAKPVWGEDSYYKKE